MVIDLLWLEALLSLVQVFVLELCRGQRRSCIVEFVAVHSVKHLVVVNCNHGLGSWFGELAFAVGYV